MAQYWFWTRRACCQAAFGTNDLFGIPEVLARGLWDLTAVANGKTVVRIFPAEALFQTLAEMPPEHDRFLRGIASMA